jgi:hypothetical protein
MARSENPAPKETVETYVIVKGAPVYPLHDQENAYQVRDAAYAVRVSPGSKPGWHWYRLQEESSLWRDGIHPLAMGDQILVGPKGAVKKK